MATEVGKEMCEIGKKILQALAKIPEAQTPDAVSAGYLKVFAEVLGEVGKLFEAGEVKEDLLKQLGSISTYTNLLPYMLSVKQILNRMQEMVKIDKEVHKNRLYSISQQLTQLAVKTVVIVKNLEDLGKLLSEIIRSNDEKFKESHLKEFDFQVVDISVSIKGCFESLLLVKSRIEEGLSKVEVERLWLQSSTNILIVATTAIITPFAHWLKGAIGIYDLIGVENAGLSMNPENQKLEEIQKQYKEQQYCWKDLDDQLNELKDKLNLAIKKCKYFENK